MNASLSASYQLPAAKNPMPRAVGLEVLWGCNLKCNYCYIGAENNWKAPVVPTVRSLYSIIDKIVAAGVEELYLIGGEPMAHPKFDDICAYVAARQIPVRGICTNGTYITPRAARLLKDLGFFVDVTFRGDNANTFDHIAGVPGAFERALQGCIIMSEEGVSLGIEFDCTRQTASGLYSLVADLLTRGVKIHQVFLHRIAPQGDARYLSVHETSMESHDYGVVFEQAKRVKNEFGIPTHFEDGFPLCLTDISNWEHIVPCECGTYLATVDPQGNVRHCACHPRTLGNILVDPLETIWNESESLKEFRSLEWLPQACKTCALRSCCRGGCSVSSATSHEGFAPDAFADQFVPLQDTGRLVVTKNILGQDVLLARPVEPRSQQPDTLTDPRSVHNIPG